MVGHREPFHLRTTPTFVLLLAVAACGSEYKLHQDIWEEGDEYAEECDAICDEYKSGCNVKDCGVDVAAEMSDDESTWDLMEPGPDGTCEIVVGICYFRRCAGVADECSDQNNNPTACADEQAECNIEGDCLTARDQCEYEAMLTYDECVLGPTADGCDIAYHEAVEVCTCVYEACLTGEEPSCTQQAYYLSPPIQIGPHRWTVSRQAIDEQLARLHQLDVETLVWPTTNAEGEWAGIYVGSIEPGDALHTLGLRDGDVLTKIQGHPIIDVFEHVDEALSLLDAQSIVLRLRRDGQPQEHRYDLVD